MAAVMAAAMTVLFSFVECYGYNYLVQLTEYRIFRYAILNSTSTFTHEARLEAPAPAVLLVDPSVFLFSSPLFGSLLFENQKGKDGGT